MKEPLATCHLTKCLLHLILMSMICWPVTLLCASENPVQNWYRNFLLFFLLWRAKRVSRSVGFFTKASTSFFLAPDFSQKFPFFPQNVPFVSQKVPFVSRKVPLVSQKVPFVSQKIHLFLKKFHLFLKIFYWFPKRFSKKSNTLQKNIWANPENVLKKSQTFS